MLGLHEGIMNHAQAPANALLDISKKMAATPFKVNVQGVGAVSSGSGVGGSVVFIQNIDARPTLNGNLIHERDLAFVIQDALVKAGRRQGGNLFNGTIR
jgi:hypothetical protein